MMHFENLGGAMIMKKSRQYNPFRCVYFYWTTTSGHGLLLVLQMINSMVTCDSTHL